MKEKGKGNFRNRLRRSLGLFIAAVMIFSVIPLNGLWPSAYAETDFRYGSGTQEDPYQIQDLTDLETLSKNVNAGKTYEGCYFKMTKDIDMTTKYKANSASWTPIGYWITRPDSKSFEGSFDGAGHKITLYLKVNKDYYGLFGFVGEGGKVENLEVDGNVIGDTKHNYVAGIVGLLKGKLENCSNKASIEAEKVIAGGLVGYAADSKAAIRYCYNEGEVSGKSVGGVAGLVMGGGVIENCYNTGYVYSTEIASSEGEAGGICYRKGGGDISNCYNTGKIHGNGKAGGICGWATGSIENCHNTGEITGKNGVGGICGYSSGVKIINCYNTGVVKGVSSSTAVIGGVIGHVVPSESGYSLLVENCYNIGNVTAESCSSPIIGGILGQSENTDTTISGCYYDNTVCTSASDNISGITGIATADFKTKSVFAGWDFKIWGMSEDRPLLRSVKENGHHIMHSMSTDCSDAEGETLLAFEPLTKSVLEGKLSDDNKYYVIDSGDYFLAEDITLEKEIQIKDKTVNLCLNGHTINRSSGNAISVSGKSELNICDCRGGGEVLINKYGSAIKVAQNTDTDTELKTLNIYGGTIIGRDYNKSFTDGAVYVGANCIADVNIYGGTLKGFQVSAVTIDSGTLTVDGEAVDISTSCNMSGSGAMGGVYAEDAVVNINQGKIYSDDEYSYGVVLYGRVQLNITGGNIEGSKSGIRNQGDNNNIKISGGTVTGKKAQAIGTNDIRRYNISISGNPEISGVCEKDATVESDIYLGDYGKIVISEELTNTEAYIVECPEDTKKDITKGWSEHMQGKDPEKYFKLCEYPKNKTMVLNETTGELKVRNIIISMDANGGKFKSGAAKTVEVTDGNAILSDQFDKLPKDMTRQYYTFSYWTTEKDNPDTRVTENTVFTDDATIYAYYTHEHTYGGYSLTQNEKTGEVIARRDCLNCPTNYSESLAVDVILKESEISAVYSGSAQKPQPVVTMNGEDITENFGIEWSDNTDVGTAVITLTGKDDFSGTIKKTFEITPAALTVTGAKAADRDYDGTNMVEITEITLDGIKNGDDVQASAALMAALDSSNAGTYEKIKLPELTLTGEKAENYKLAQLDDKVSLSTSVVIGKAKSWAVSGRLEIKNNFGRTYSFALNSLRPKEVDEADWGESEQYEIFSADVDSRYAGKDDIKLEGNILKMKVKPVQDGSEGKVGTVTVKIKTDNYEDFTGTVEIYAADIEAGVIKIGNTTITIPEGKTVSEDEKGNITIPEGSKAVSGGTSVTVLNREGIVDLNGKLTAPSGSTAVTEGGISIVLSAGGSLDGEGLLEAEKAVVGNTIITAPTGETVMIHKDGSTEVSKGGTIEIAGTIVTITEGTGVVGKDGAITFLKGGKVMVEKDGKTESISIPAGGNIKLNVDNGTGNGDTGNGGTGNGGTGSSGTGSDDTGNGGTGSSGTGSDDTGNGDTGSSDTGNDGTGNSSTGSDNTDNNDSQKGNVIKQEGTTTDKSISAVLGDATDILKNIVFDEKELSLIKEGKNASVWMTVEDITDTVSETDKSLILKATDGYKTGAFLDLNCFKQIDGGEEVHLTELEKDITVSLTVPEELKNTDSSIKRTYTVLRVHESEAKLLEGSYDETTGVLTFKTGFFSTYVICYRDEAVGKPSGDIVSGNTGTEDKAVGNASGGIVSGNTETGDKAVGNASGGTVSEDIETGDKAPIALCTMVIILSGIVAFAVSKKKRLTK